MTEYGCGCVIDYQRAIVNALTHPSTPLHLATDMLEARGWTTFFARTDLSPVTEAALRRAVENSRVVVTVLDPVTLSSPWVRKENMWAFNSGVPISKFLWSIITNSVVLASYQHSPTSSPFAPSALLSLHAFAHTHHSCLSFPITPLVNPPTSRPQSTSSTTTVSGGRASWIDGELFTRGRSQGGIPSP